MKKFSITKNGEPLPKFLYTWDEQTRTFSSVEADLALDFKDIDYCTFKTGSNCKFITGSNCTFDAGHDCKFITGSNCTFDAGHDCKFITGDDCIFNTGHNCNFETGFGCAFNTSSDCIFETSCNCVFNVDHNCTFITGDDCTFDTGHNCTFTTGDDCTFDVGSFCTFNTGSFCTFKTDSNCTFDTSHNCTFNTDSNCIFTTDLNCVVIRRDVYEFYDISNTNGLNLAPYGIKGYVNDGYYYKDGKKQYKAIIFDNILSEIIEHKGNVYKVKNYKIDNISYLVHEGDVYSHGKTLKEAKDSLIYKLSNRDTSQYKNYTLDTKVSKKEAIRMYRAITGACEQGTKMFIESLDKVPRNLTVEKIIELTKGQYGNDTFKKFFEEVSE